MLYKNENRNVVKLKAKNGIVNLAERLYKKKYPFSTGCNLDDLFEEMVTVSAANLAVFSEEEIAELKGETMQKESTEDPVITNETIIQEPEDIVDEPQIQADLLDDIFNNENENETSSQNLVRS